MNNIDIVPVLEWATKARRSEMVSERRRKPEQPDDLMTMLRKRYDENRILEQFFKDIEKINKKEPDKKKWLALSTEQLQMVLIGIFTLVAPFYLWLFTRY